MAAFVIAMSCSLLQEPKMDTIKLSAIISLLFALSVASERLVEIVKGLIPSLNRESADPTKEGWRRCLLQVLAVGAGILTVWLTKDAVPHDLFNVDKPGVV